MFAGTQVSHLLGSKSLIKISTQQIYTLKPKSLPKVIFLQYILLLLRNSCIVWLFEWSVVNGNVLGQDQILFICKILKADWPEFLNITASNNFQHKPITTYLKKFWVLIHFHPLNRFSFKNRNIWSEWK